MERIIYNGREYRLIEDGKYNNFYISKDKKVIRKIDNSIKEYTYTDNKKLQGVKFKHNGRDTSLAMIKYYRKLYSGYENIGVPIKGYEDKYRITKDGFVYSIERDIMLNHVINVSGYHIVSLLKNNVSKIHFVHKLVAEAYIPNPNNYTQVNHIDKNKNNNSVENLEWCTPMYNCNHRNDNIINGMTIKCTNVISGDIKYFNNVQECAEAINVNRHLIVINVRKNRLCGKYKIEYV